MTQVSTSDRTHARSGPETPRAEAQSHTQNSNTRTHTTHQSPDRQTSLREDAGPFTRPFLVHPGAPPRGPKFCHTREAPRRGTHALPPSPIHLRRPPASRLWVSSVAETRRVCNASRLEMWLRCSTWLHLHFPYGCAAQLHSSESAFGAMPPLRAVEPDRAGPTTMLSCSSPAGRTPLLRPAHMFSCVLAVQRPAIKAERLAAHL